MGGFHLSNAGGIDRIDRPESLEWLSFAYVSPCFLGSLFQLAKLGVSGYYLPPILKPSPSKQGLFCLGRCLAANEDWQPASAEPPITVAMPKSACQQPYLTPYRRRHGAQLPLCPEETGHGIEPHACGQRAERMAASYEAMTSGRHHP